MSRRKAPDGEPLMFISRLIHEAEPTEECILWPYSVWPSKGGKPYGKVVINGKQQFAHRAICKAIRGDVPGMDACHSCGNSLCVNPHHIRWDTRKGNLADRVQHGTVPHSERNGKTKLTVSDVLAIRSDERPYAKIAEHYGVSYRTVYSIRARLRWTHLK